MVTKIVVPSLGEPGLAENALMEQEIEYETFSVDGGAAYSHQLARIWREGEGFLLIEADLAPPPGAVEEICGCEHPWCSAPYISPILHISLGVLKLTTEAVQETQDLPAVWEGEHWGTLDSKLIPSLLARQPLHSHLPPWGHERFR